MPLQVRSLEMYCKSLQVRPRPKALWLYSKLLSIISPRPNPILPRRKNPLRIKRIFNRLIQLHLRIAIEVIRLRNLIHERQMRPVLSPSLLRSVFDKRAYK